ncbi:MAG: pyruvate kinase, partial [Flavobacteriales bacterium]|nr:pyruvate kinase [Flavobacteriales bacterium]
MKRTKIVATIGPATSSYEMLKEIIQEGVDVIRLNFSHGSHEDHQKVIEHVRRINSETNYNIALLADLQGPKLRTDDMTDNRVELVDGQEVIITTKKVLGTAKKFSTNYQSFAQDVNAGEEVRLDDGKLHLLVKETNNKDEVKCEVIHGGILSSKKGINLPNTNISLPCLTEKDLKDLHFALDQDVDWIGLSFVRSARDIIELKHIIKEREKHALVIAKIEKPEALDEIDDIILETDALMVARGDLGVE